MDLNRATVLGRLTRDPELKSLASGRSVATFSVATSRMWTDQSGQKQSQTEYHNVVIWGKMAEVAGQYLRKGSRIYIEGRIQTRDWTPQDGIKRYRTEIIADNMIMLDSKGSAPMNSSTTESSANSFASPNAAEEVVEEEIKVEDIPF
jgi:single-strand DNA-binding protein